MLFIPPLFLILAKDKVTIGEFSRYGKTRVEKGANDHDLGDGFMTHFGILNVGTDGVSISMTKSKITADFIVDRLEEYWVKENLREFKNTLLLSMHYYQYAHVENCVALEKFRNKWRKIIR